jgi:nicotinate-nucleotide adenylyltransferase
LSQPLGLMGGTFDPVHFGHLRLAEEAAVHLQLERVRWIPSGSPGHRAAPRTDAGHRLEMVRRAIAGNPRFAVDDAEAQASAPQFTIDTLRRLRRELGTSVPLVMIIGTDQLHRLDTWRSWRELFAHAHFAVGERPGYPIEREALPSAVGQELAQRAAPARGLRDAPAGRIATFPMTMLAISASDIRDRIATGGSARYLLPPEVLAYIGANDLYRGST